MEDHSVEKASDLSDSHRICYFGCLEGVSKSVQVLFNGMEAAMVLTSEPCNMI